MRADGQREALGFLSVAATDALAELGVRVLDPASTLVSARVVFGQGVVLYPTVIVDADEHARVEVGPGCVLYPGCVLEAREGGQITVGANGELGPGGVHLRAAGVESRLILRDEVRLAGGCELMGACELGKGAQILGAVSARSVRLGGGLGGHRWPVADERGAVLKGAGIADGVALRQGEVKNCRASFSDVPVERQSAYHPSPGMSPGSRD